MLKHFQLKIFFENNTVTCINLHEILATVHVKTTLFLHEVIIYLMMSKMCKTYISNVV